MRLYSTIHFFFFFLRFYVMEDGFWLTYDYPGSKENALKSAVQQSISLSERLNYANILFPHLYLI